MSVRSYDPMTKTITTIDSPNDIAINTDTNTIFVANVWSNILTVIDGNTNSIIKNISLESFPSAFSINQNLVNEVIRKTNNIELLL